MTIIVSGGGSGAIEREILCAFAGQLADDQPVLYLPLALTRRDEYPDRPIAWVRAALGEVGITQVEAWASLEGKAPSDLAAFCAIFIGGGNTFDLLHALRESHMVDAIRGFEREDGLLFGGSAGAIVLGASIGSAVHCDANLAGLSDLCGLNLLSGCDVWCHFESKDHVAVARYASEAGRSVLALEEGAGALVTDGQVQPLGRGQCLLCNSSGVWDDLGARPTRPNQALHLAGFARR